MCKSCSSTRDKRLHLNRWMFLKKRGGGLCVCAIMFVCFCAFFTNCHLLSFFTVYRQRAEMARQLWRFAGGIKQPSHADDSLTGRPQEQYGKKLFTALANSRQPRGIEPASAGAAPPQSQLPFQGETFFCWDISHVLDSFHPHRPSGWFLKASIKPVLRLITFIAPFNHSRPLTSLFLLVTREDVYWFLSSMYKCGHV